MEKLDMLDKRIIAVLNRDPRLPFSAIAKKVRSSKEVVNYRVKRLMSKGVISRFVTSFDLGSWPYKTLIQFEKISAEEEKNLIGFLENHPNTQWITPCSGHWDLVLSIMAKDPHEYDRTMREIIRKSGKHFHDYKFSIQTSTKVFAHKYLLGKSTAEVGKKILGKSVELDDKDAPIAAMLQKDARTKLADISTKTGIPIDTVKYRIKRMMDSGVIKYFRMILNPSRIGYQRYAIFIRCVNLSEKTVMRFEEYARQNPNIIFYGRCVGGWDVEFTAYLKSNDDLRHLMFDIKKEFSDHIKKAESINLFATQKYNYRPSEVLNTE
jgi:DNA-binding Lrp family transcriptional regulator